MYYIRIFVPPRTSMIIQEFQPIYGSLMSLMAYLGEMVF